MNLLRLTAWIRRGYAQTFFDAAPNETQQATAATWTPLSTTATSVEGGGIWVSAPGALQNGNATGTAGTANASGSGVNGGDVYILLTDSTTPSGAASLAGAHVLAATNTQGFLLPWGNPATVWFYSASANVAVEWTAMRAGPTA